MSGIEIRASDGKWKVVAHDQAAKWLRQAPWVFLYDQIETPADRVQVLDLAIPAFLRAAPNFKRLLQSLRAPGEPDPKEIFANMTDRLRAVPSDVDLWEWRTDGDRNRATLESLFEACRFKGFALASITKMLHLKRPRLIPIIDDWVRQAWIRPYRRKWTMPEAADLTFRMGDELSLRLEGLNELRGVARSLGWPYDALSTLRLYDIVFWSYEAERRKTELGF